MALEPITRQEKIIAGQNLTPITRMEKFLKQYGGGRGASSWNDLGEKTTTTMGDTLTWDGNTEGLVYADATAVIGANLYKVSDAMPNIDDFANGVTVDLYSGTTIPITADGVAVLVDGLIAETAYYTFFVVSHEAVGVNVDGIVFNETGVYLKLGDGDYISSLTIPGYGKFETTETVITPIPTKYLPEHLQFGETVVGGLKITEDDVANGEKADMGEGMWIAKVSDEVYTAADFAGLKIVYFSDGNTVTEDAPVISDEMMPNCVVITTSSGQTVAYAFSAPMESPTGDMISAGLWVEGNDVAGGYKLISFEAAGTTIVTPMDEKYMPVLTSPNGTKYKISVADDGTISATAV